MTITEQTSITKITEILKGFRERTKVACVILYTQDGSILSIEADNSLRERNSKRLIGIIYSNIMTLIKQCIIQRKENYNLKQVSIQAGENLDLLNGFKIVLDTVRENLFLLVIIPTSLNLGVIFFELNNTLRRINKEII